MAVIIKDLEGCTEENEGKWHQQKRKDQSGPVIRTRKTHPEKPWITKLDMNVLFLMFQEKIS